MPIIFKVWCKNKNEWEKHPCRLTEDGVLIDILHQISLKPETHVVVWFSGLKDKYLNPIYRNDIVKFHWSTFQGNHESTCLVTYKRYRWLLEVIGKDEAAMGLTPSTCFDPAFTTPIQYEVIGNAYKNPDLLGEVPE